MAVQLTFRLSLPDSEWRRVSNSCSVFVTGAPPALGGWQADGSLRMDQADDRSWSITVSTTTSSKDHLPCSEEGEKEGQVLEYRYFLGKVLKDGRVCVKRWESDRNPRRVVLERKETVFEDTFGLGQQGEPLDVSEGWLQCETMVQILIHPTKQQPISMQHKGPIKLCFCLQQREDSGSLLDEQPMHVKVLDMQTGDCEVPDQSGTGVLFDERKMVVAVARTEDYENTVYYVDVYSAEPPAVHLGRCFITHHMLSDPSQSGFLDLPVIVKGGNVVGNIAVGYTVVRPCECPLVHSMKQGAELRVWKEQGVLMGHRGLGATVGVGSRDLAHPENTIASFKEAAKQGAEWIEFDILMSKDGHLFVNHSITATIAIETKSGLSTFCHKISLADFTLKELHSMKIVDTRSPTRGHEGGPLYLSDVSSEEESLFPTLQQVFDAIPPEVGLDIDVKYALPCDDGSERFPYLDRNMYADAVLREVYRLGTGRKIVFTCLDTDLALCLHHKQPHIAVIYCTNGGLKVWPAPLDKRATSHEASLAFCASEGLSLVSPTMALVENHSLVVKTRASGVALFLYGELTAEKKHREELGRLGVNAFILDGIAQYLPFTR